MKTTSLSELLKVLANNMSDPKHFEFAVHELVDSRRTEFGQDEKDTYFERYNLMAEVENEQIKYFNEDSDLYDVDFANLIHTRLMGFLSIYIALGQLLKEED